MKKPNFGKYQETIMNKQPAYYTCVNIGRDSAKGL